MSELPKTDVPELSRIQMPKFELQVPNIIKSDQYHLYYTTKNIDDLYETKPEQINNIYSNIWNYTQEVTVSFPGSFEYNSPEYLIYGEAWIATHPRIYIIKSIPINLANKVKQYNPFPYGNNKITYPNNGRFLRLPRHIRIIYPPTKRGFTSATRNSTPVDDYFVDIGDNSQVITHVHLKDPLAFNIYFVQTHIDGRGDYVWDLPGYLFSRTNNSAVEFRISNVKPDDAEPATADYDDVYTLYNSVPITYLFSGLGEWLSDKLKSLGPIASDISVSWGSPTTTYLPIFDQYQFNPPLYHITGFAYLEDTNRWLRYAIPGIDKIDNSEIDPKDTVIGPTMLIFADDLTSEPLPDNYGINDFTTLRGSPYLKLDHLSFPENEFTDIVQQDVDLFKQSWKRYQKFKGIIFPLDTSFITDPVDLSTFWAAETLITRYGLTDYGWITRHARGALNPADSSNSLSNFQQYYSDSVNPTGANWDWLWQQILDFFDLHGK